MSKPITSNDLYQALGAKLKPVLDALKDVKNQLNTLNSIVSDLDGRMKAIEKRLAEMKAKA